MSKGLVGMVEGFSKDVLLVRAQDGSVKRIVFSGTTASDIAKAEGLDDLTQIVGKQVRVAEDGSEFLFFDEVVPKSQTKDYKPLAKPKKAPNTQGLDFGTGKPEPVEEPTGEGVFEGDKEKDPKHVAKGMRQRFEGGHIIFDMLPDRLVIHLTQEGKEFLEEHISGRDGEEIQWDAESWDSLFSDLLEPLLVNSDWEILRPEEIGGLTDAPILGYDTQRDDQGNLLKVEHVYWFPDYQILDPLEVLYTKGQVEFQEAPEDKTPETSVELKASRTAKGKEKWMQEAFPEKSSGALHKALGVAEDHKFTITELEGHKKKLSQKAKKSKLTKSELHLEKMLVSAINAMRSKKGSLGRKAILTLSEYEKAAQEYYKGIGKTPSFEEVVTYITETILEEGIADDYDAVYHQVYRKLMKQDSLAKKGSLSKSARKANIYYDGKIVGTADLTEEEALHFSNAPTCAAGVVLTPFEMERMGLNPDQQVQVDVLDDVGRLGSKRRKATGEPDQDYDHEFFDEITEQLIQANFQHVTHKEFDKYQGVYLRVGDIRETFWVDEVFYTGKKQPGSESSLGDFTYQPGTETEHWIFIPQSNRGNAVEVTKGPGGTVDASSLVNYCKHVRRRLLKEQGFKGVSGSRSTKVAKVSFESKETYKDFSMNDAETLLTYHGGMSSYLYAVGSTLYAALMNEAAGRRKEIPVFSREYITGAIQELADHKKYLQAHPDDKDSGTIEEVDYLIKKLHGLRSSRAQSTHSGSTPSYMSALQQELLGQGFTVHLEDAGAKLLVHRGPGFEVEITPLESQYLPDDFIPERDWISEQEFPKCVISQHGEADIVVESPDVVETVLEKWNAWGKMHVTSRAVTAGGMDARVLAPLQKLYQGKPIRMKEVIRAWKEMGFDVEVDFFGDNSNKYEVIWEHPETKLFNEGATSDYERDMGHIFNTMEKLKPEYMDEYCSGGVPKAHGMGGSYALPPYLWTLGHVGNTTEVGIWPPWEECAPVEVDTRQIPLGFEGPKERASNLSPGDISQHIGSSTHSAHGIVVMDPEGQDHYDVVVGAIKDVVNTMKRANPRGFADEADSRFPDICLEVAQALGAQFRENKKGECIFDFSNPGTSKSWLAGQKRGGLRRSAFKTLEDLVHSQPSNSTYFDDGEGLTGIPNTQGKILWYRWTQAGYSLAGSTDTPEGAQEKKLPVHVGSTKWGAGEKKGWPNVLRAGSAASGLSFVTRTIEGLLDSDEILVSSEAGDALVQVQDAIYTGATPGEVRVMLADLLADPDANVSSELGEILESLQERLYQISAVAHRAKRGTSDGIGLGKGSYEDILDALHKKGDVEDPEALASWIFHKNTGHWPAEKANRPRKKKGSVGRTAGTSCEWCGTDTEGEGQMIDGRLWCGNYPECDPDEPGEYGPPPPRYPREDGFPLDSGSHEKFMFPGGSDFDPASTERPHFFQMAKDFLDRHPGYADWAAIQALEEIEREDDAGRDLPTDGDLLGYGFHPGEGQELIDAYVKYKQANSPDPREPYEVNLASGKYRLPRDSARKQAKEKTLAEQAEAWCSEKGAKIPPRGTAKWREMYEQWANWAFADLHPDKKKASVGEPVTQEVSPEELAPGMKVEHKGAFYTVKKVRTVDYGKEEKYLQVFFTDRDTSLLFAPRLKVKIKASNRRAYYDEDEGDNRPPCPMCGGPGNFLGALGHREHFRCENCGVDFSQTTRYLQGHPDFTGPTTILKPEVREGSVPDAPSPIWSSAEEAKQWLAQIREQVKAPYLGGYVSSLGGDARASIEFTVSGQPKEEWPNKILENSTYAKLSLGHDGVLEAFSGHGKWKFRKTRVRTVEQALSKLQVLADQLVAEASGGPKAPERGATQNRKAYTPLEGYVIRSESEQGYWSNEDGWVYDVASATVFPEQLESSLVSKGWDAEWVSLSEAQDFSDLETCRECGMPEDHAPGCSCSHEGLDTGHPPGVSQHRKADPSLNEKLEHYMEYVNSADDLTGYYVCPDGWGPPSGGEKLLPSEWEMAKYRLPIHAPGRIKGVAVNVTVTGAPQHKWGALWQRVKIEFVGDGEPSEFAGGWVLVKHPHTGSRKHRAYGMGMADSQTWGPNEYPSDEWLESRDRMHLSSPPMSREEFTALDRDLRHARKGEDTEAIQDLTERLSPMRSWLRSHHPSTEHQRQQELFVTSSESRRAVRTKSYSVIVSPSMKAFWSNQYGWVKFVDEATKFPFSSSDMKGMPPTEDGDAQWMPLEQAEKLVFGPEGHGTPTQQDTKALEEYADELPYPTHMASEESTQYLPARFRVSGLDLGRGVLGWYDPSENWNGFACPLFAKVAADKIVQAHNFPSTGNRGDDMKAYYDEAQDAYVFPEDNTYVGRDITTDPSNLYTESEGTTYTRHLYPIGDHSWPWEPHGGFMSVDSEG